MNDWTLKIPHEHRTDSLVSVGDLAAALPAEDRAVVREIIPVAAQAGLHNAGALCDRLESLSPESRRAVLDCARGLADLEPIAKVEGRWQVEEASRQARERAAANAPDAQWGFSPTTGALANLAPDKPLRLGYNASGLVVDLDEVEAEQQRAIAAENSLRRRRENERVEREQALAEAQDRERARDEQRRRETPAGMP